MLVINTNVGTNMLVITQMNTDTHMIRAAVGHPVLQEVHRRDVAVPGCEEQSGLPRLHIAVGNRYLIHSRRGVL